MNKLSNHYHMIRNKLCFWRIEKPWCTEKFWRTEKLAEAGRADRSLRGISVPEKSGALLLLLLSVLLSASCAEKPGMEPAQGSGAEMTGSAAQEDTVSENGEGSGGENDADGGGGAGESDSADGRGGTGESDSADGRGGAGESDGANDRGGAGENDGANKSGGTEKNAAADRSDGHNENGAGVTSGDARWSEQFGENCIASQTFEVELSEYEGSVCFVPFAPAGEENDFSMQIVKDGEALTEISPYVPEALSNQDFGSLDAVTFYDVNYDGNTDMILIETYGDTTFVAVYYGYAAEAEGDRSFFMVQEELSVNLSEQLEQPTIPEIRRLLSGGKKNGEFSDYREAYEAVSRLCEWEGTKDITYDLIYFDEDDIPELVAGVAGYYVSMYTYSGGKVYTLMDRWAYGAMGNSGYEYVPYKNSLRNYNSDYAGAILYTTYMSANQYHTLETIVEIKTMNFDDVNQNGFPDEDEAGSIGRYGVSYINDRVVSDAECAAYSAGEYKYIKGAMDVEALKAKL